MGRKLVVTNRITLAMKWCIYAMGGGLGHLVRSLGLAREVVARGHQVTILANTAYAPLLPVNAELGELGNLIAIPPTFDRDQVTDFIHRTIRSHVFDTLIVDTFPRGLAGELAVLLPELPMMKVLVHRDLNPLYVERAHVEQFVENYDLIIGPGEIGPLADRKHIHVTSPWLIRGFKELLDLPSAWQALRVDRIDFPVIAVLAAGFSAEAEAMLRLAQRLSKAVGERANIRFITFDKTVDPRGTLAINLWPTLSAIRGINLLIGAGGYNTVFEARSTQTPLIAISRPRLYDRQQLRLADTERALDENDAFARTISWLEANGCLPRAEVPVYENGTEAAVRIVEHRLTGLRASFPIR